MANILDSTSGTELKTLIRQPETIVGALMLCILAIMGSQTLYQAGNLWSSSIPINQPISLNVTLPSPTENLSLTDSSSAKVATTPSASSSALITTQEQTATISATPSPTPTTSATSQPSSVAAPSASSITVALNQSENIIVARINDTFWDIARRTCGQGIQGYRIKEENGYTTKHLHPGDRIVVTCN